MAFPSFKDVSPEAAWSNYPADYATVQRGGHCGVLASAIFAGVSFEMAWAHYSRGRSANWKGSVYVRDFAPFLRSLGVPFKQRQHIARGDLQWLRQSRSPSLNDYALRCNVATFAARHAAPGVTYLLIVRGHAVTLRDGIVMDQEQAAPAASHWTARKIINRSFERL